MAKIKNAFFSLIALSCQNCGGVCALPFFFTFAANMAFATIGANAANAAKEANMAQVFSVATMKGGAGKSTVTMLLAAALARQKAKRVLIIDADSQATIFEFADGIENALATVEALQPRQVKSYLQRFASNFDVILFDVPRVTDKSLDSLAVMLLAYCDAVLVPVIGSQVDVMATLDFVNVLNQLQAEQQAGGMDFEFWGFINRRNKRKDNEQAADVLRANGLRMFDNSLADLKIFTSPSLETSILDSMEGQTRFGAFFAEFCQKFKID